MPAFAFIPGDTIQWAAVLIDAAVKGLVVLLLAAGATLLLRWSSAAVRHMTWTLSIAALILVPFLSLALPQLQVPLLPDWAGAGGPARREQAAAQSPAVVELPVGTGGPGAESVMPAGDWPSPAGAPQPVHPADAAPETPAAPVLAAAAPQTPPVHWSAWVLLAWLAGAAALLLPLLAGTIIVWRQARRAERIDSGSWVHLLDELRPQLGVRGRVVLLRSNWPNIPLTCGIFRPAIILPAEADNWPADRRRVVLLHELAHIRRRDCLTQLLARLARVIYWFNPLVWLAGRMLRIEREQACDDLVLASGHKASDYAGHLLEIVRSLHSVRCPSLAAVAMARKSQFEGRLLAILDPRRNRRSLTHLGVVLAAVILAAVAVPLAILHATAAAPETEPAKAEPATQPAADPEGPWIGDRTFLVKSYGDLVKLYDDLAAGADRQEILNRTRTALAELPQNEESQYKRSLLEELAGGLEPAIAGQKKLASLPQGSVGRLVGSLIDSTRPSSMWIAGELFYSSDGRWATGEKQLPEDVFDRIATLGDKAIPSLIERLDDKACSRAFLRSRFFDEFPGSPPHLMRVNELALCLIEQITGCYFERTDAPAICKKHVALWWSKVADKPKVDRLKWQFPYAPRLLLDRMFDELLALNQQEFLKQQLLKRYDATKKTRFPDIEADMLARLGVYVALGLTAEDLKDCSWANSRHNYLFYRFRYGGPKEYEAIAQSVKARANPKFYEDDYPAQVLFTASEEKKPHVWIILDAFLGITRQVKDSGWHGPQGTEHVRYCDAAMWELARRGRVKQFDLAWPVARRDAAIQGYLQAEANPPASQSAPRPAETQPATQPAGSKLEFRIAPSPSDLTKAELADYAQWLKRGLVGFWWRERHVDGRFPDFAFTRAWLPVVGKLPSAEQLVTGEYNGQKYVLVSDKPGQTMLPGEGKDAWGLAKVFATTDAMNRPAVGFEMDDRGVELFTALTKANIGNALAIVVDGKVISAPRLMSALGRAGIITGRFSEQEVQALVKALKAGMPLTGSSEPPAPAAEEGLPPASAASSREAVELVEKLTALARAGKAPKSEPLAGKAPGTYWLDASQLSGEWHRRHDYSHIVLEPVALTESDPYRTERGPEAWSVLLVSNPVPVIGTDRTEFVWLSLLKGGRPVQVGPALPPTLVWAPSMSGFAEAGRRMEIVKTYIDNQKNTPNSVGARRVMKLGGLTPATQPASQPAGSKLEFRIAPTASLLTNAERDIYMDGLKAGRVGPWWETGEKQWQGQIPVYMWLPIAGELTNAPQLVTGEHNGQKYVLVSDKPGQTMVPGEGKEAWGLTRVYATTDGANQPAVGFELDDRGAELFSAFTKANIGNTLAIVVDGKVVSAPVLMSALGKQGMITGRFTEQEVQALVKALQAGMPAGGSATTLPSVPPASGPVAKPGCVGPGGVLRIGVLDLLEEGKEAVYKRRVSESGNIWLPALDEPVKVQDANQQEIRDIIAKAYGALSTTNPSVTVTILQPTGTIRPLAPGDVIDLQVHDKARGQILTLHRQIQPDGTLEVPDLKDRVKAAGLTIEGLEQSLSRQLGKRAEVTLELSADLRPGDIIDVSVMGLFDDSALEAVVRREISAKGTIDLPNIQGLIAAAGMLPDALSKAISKLYGGKTVAVSVVSKNRLPFERPASTQPAGDGGNNANATLTWGKGPVRIQDGNSVIEGKRITIEDGHMQVEGNAIIKANNGAEVKADRIDIRPNAPATQPAPNGASTQAGGKATDAVATKELDRLWDRLGSADSIEAYKAVVEMGKQGDEAVTLIKARLRLPDISVGRIRQLIAKLDNESFADREQATSQLSQLGQRAIPALREALTEAPSAEAKIRIEGLLKTWSGTSADSPLIPALRRAVRAMAVLERIGGPGARDYIKNLAAQRVLPPVRFHDGKGFALETGFVPDKGSALVGEPLFVTFVVTNVSTQPYTFYVGGANRGSVRDNNFRITATDPGGKAVLDPHSYRNYGGPGGSVTLKPGQTYKKRLFLGLWCDLAEPGEYVVACQRILNGLRGPDAVAVTNTFPLTIRPADAEKMREVIATWGAELRCGDKDKVLEATTALAAIKDEAVIPYLIESLKMEGGLGRESMAVEGLARFNSDAAADGLCLALKDPDYALARDAAAALKRTAKINRAVDKLLAELRAPETANRAVIVRALGYTGARQVASSLVAALRDENTKVRQAAAEGLGWLGYWEHIAVLKKCLTSDDLDLRVAAVQALIRLEQPIESKWLVDVIIAAKGKKGVDLPRSFHDATSLLRLHGKGQGATALVSCLDFDNATTNCSYNFYIINQIESCTNGPPKFCSEGKYHHEPNTEGTPDEIKDNRLALAVWKKWLAEQEAVKPPALPKEVTESLGEAMKIRVKHHNAGLPMWRELAALVKPGWTVQQMKLILTCPGGGGMGHGGGRVTISYGVQNAFMVRAEGKYVPGASYEHGDGEDKIILTYPPTVTEIRREKPAENKTDELGGRI